jgi:hypothetical protein
MVSSLGCPLFPLHGGWGGWLRGLGHRNLPNNFLCSLKVGGRFTPSYSTHLSLPNNHSIIILNVTRNKKTTILIIKPLDHKTKGVTDIIINSKSKIKKIIQKIKNRNETGKTLTLKESKPHSNVSTLIAFLLTRNLPNPITRGTKTEINK